MIREAATDADTYTMQFKQDGLLAPQQKAIMVASAVMTGAA